MPPDGRPEPERPQPSDAQRAAALRALQAERTTTSTPTSAPAPTPVFGRRDAGAVGAPAATDRAAGGDGDRAVGAAPDGGASAPGDGSGAGGPSRVPLILGLLAVVAVVAVVAVLALGGDDDPSTTEAGASSTTTAEVSTTVTTAAEATSTTVAEASTTTSVPSSLRGAPRPAFDPTTDDIDQLATQTIAFRQWLYANPDVGVVEAGTVEGSQARTRLTAELGLLDEAGQAAEFEGYLVEVTEADGDAGSATATWVESYDRLVVVDAATGDVGSERPGPGLVEVRASWVRAFDGSWLLDTFEGG